MKKRNLILLLSTLFVILTFVFISAVSQTVSIIPTNATGEAGLFQLYNFTVNNLNTTGVNITQVNLTLINAPASLNITSNGTNTNATITNPSLTTFEFTNKSISLISNGTSGSFWFNSQTNQTGNFTVNISTLDALNNLSSTLLNITISDTTPPTISFVNQTPAGGTLNVPYIPVNVTASDSGSGLKNITIYLYNSTGLVGLQSNAAPFFYNFTGLINGTYYLNATAYDNSNNSNSISSITLAINTSTSSGSSQCIQNWNYTWGSCTNGNQTKIWTDLNNCNNITGQPAATNQSCSTNPSCVTSWSCTDWTPAICPSDNGNQTRTCTDSNGCVLPKVETRDCSLGSAVTTNSSSQQTGTSTFSLSSAFFVVMGIIIISIIGVVVILMRLKKKSYSTDFGNSSESGGYRSFSPRSPPSSPPGFSNPPQTY